MRHRHTRPVFNHLSNEPGCDDQGLCLRDMTSSDFQLFLQQQFLLAQLRSTLVLFVERSLFLLMLNRIHLLLECGDTFGALSAFTRL